METALAVPALLAATIAKTSIRIGRAVLGSPNDLDQEWTPMFPQKHSYLRIIDVPLAQAGSATTTLVCKVDDTNCEQEPIAAVLRDLPEQERTHVRVYIEENLAHDKVFINHVVRTTSRHFADNYCQPETSAFTRIQSQCRSTRVGQWWGSQSFYLLGRTQSLGNSSISTALYANMIRCSKRIHFTTDSEDRIILFISCASTMSLSNDLFRSNNCIFGYEPKLQISQDYLTSRSSTIAFVLLDTICQRIIDIGPEHGAVISTNFSSDILKHLLFLRLIHSLLLQFSGYLDCAETLENHSNKTCIVLEASYVRGIAQDNQIYEELRGSLNNINAATEAMLQILTVKLDDVKSLQILATDLRALSNDNIRRILRLSERLDARVKCVQLYKSVGDASRSWLISILASIFLPLSLACGILSMQTRLSNLHFLLYDFCGLIILFGTIAIVILICARAYTSMRESIAQRSRIPACKQRRPVVELTIGSSALLGWGLFTTSFLVGMIKDVVLGLKILGFGTAGLTGITWLFILLNNIFWDIRQGQKRTVAVARSVA